MWFRKMDDVLYHLSQLSEYLPAVLVTSGLAVLIGCAVGCMCSPCEEKDDLFHNEGYGDVLRQAGLRAAAALLVTLTFWLQCGGMATLITWIRGAGVGDTDKLALSRTRSPNLARQINSKDHHEH